MTDVPWLKALEQILRGQGVELPAMGLLLGANLLLMLFGWWCGRIAYRRTGRWLTAQQAERLIRWPDAAAASATSAEPAAIGDRLPRFMARVAQFCMWVACASGLLWLNGFSSLAVWVIDFDLRLAGLALATLGLMAYARLVTDVILEVWQGKRLAEQAGSPAPAGPPPRPLFTAAVGKGVMVAAYSVAAIPLFVLAAELFRLPSLGAVFAGVWSLLIRLLTAAGVLMFGGVALRWYRQSAGPDDRAAKTVERVGWIVLAIIAAGVIVGSAAVPSGLAGLSGWVNWLILLALGVLAYLNRELLMDVGCGIALTSQGVSAARSSRHQYQILRVGWRESYVVNELGGQKWMANRKLWKWHRQPPAPAEPTPDAPEATPPAIPTNGDPPGGSTWPTTSNDD